MNEAEYFRSIRTQTQEDVDQYAAEHDRDDYTPAERIGESQDWHTDTSGKEGTS